MTEIYGPYRPHPIASLFPLIEGPEFDRLVADIKANGLRDPIRVGGDKTTLIDGRNRYRACERAGIQPRIEVLPADDEAEIAAFICSANIHRRHLDTGQLAIIAVEIEAFLASRTKRGRPVQNLRQNPVSRSEIPAERESRTRAGAIVGVSGSSVQRAKAVKDISPPLAEQVRTGGLKLNDAFKQASAMRKATDVPPPDAPAGRTRKLVILPTHDGRSVEYRLPARKPIFNKANDQISWAKWTWNPVTGCLHGCPYCYAREMALRYAGAYPVGFDPIFHHERLTAPANTKVPDGDDPRLKRVFVCSMADLYGQWVPDDWIKQVHQSCIDNPQWEYLMLTKFPRRYVGLELPPTAWIGTSVDEQKRVRFAEDAFRKITGVRVKWLSLEPLLAPLEFTDLSMFDFVVIGAQSETRQPDGTYASFAPPFEWVARTYAQAREAGCKVHLKPNLLGLTNPQSPGMLLPQENPLEGR